MQRTCLRARRSKPAACRRRLCCQSVGHSASSHRSACFPSKRTGLQPGWRLQETHKNEATQKTPKSTRPRRGRQLKQAAFDTPLRQDSTSCCKTRSAHNQFLGCMSCKESRHRRFPPLTLQPLWRPQNNDATCTAGPPNPNNRRSNATGAKPETSDSPSSVHARPPSSSTCQVGVESRFLSGGARRKTPCLHIVAHGFATLGA